MIQEGLRMWSQDFECGRCKAKRHDRRARRTFALLRRWYELPPGYPGRLTRAEALTALLLFMVLGRQWLLLPGLALEAIPGLGVLPFWLLVVGAIAVLGTPRPNFERH